MDELRNLFNQAQEICLNLFNSKALLEILRRPELMVAGFLVLNLVVFTETGLLVGFCLPGDSLLITAGVVASLAPNWNLPLLLATLSVAAILGDSVGYYIGYKTGPKIFNRPKSLFFNREHLEKAQAFYDKHGGKTIVLARFMPIVRTFAPVVAGVARMDYRKFLFFNVFGGVGWVVSMILTGYYLTKLIDDQLRRLLGNPNFTVADHMEKVVILVVLLSVSPAAIAWLRSKGKPAPKVAPEPEPVGAEASH